MMYQKPSDREPVIVYLAGQSWRHFAKDTEPKKYPHKFVQFVFKSLFDQVKDERDEARRKLLKYEPEVPKEIE